MEKVFHLRKDIDTLYKAGFKDIVDAVDESLKQGYMSDKLMRIMRKLNADIERRGYAVVATFFSDELQTKDAIKAHETHPVKITLEIGDFGNAYNPVKHEIRLSIPMKIMDIFNDHFWDRNNILKAAGGEATIFNEISEFKMKGTINHELSHWIRNSQTRHIDKMMKKAKETTPSMKVLKQGKIHTVATDYEMDAYVHNIMEYKKSIGLKKYNSKKLSDLFIDIPSFRAVMSHFRRYKQENISDNSYMSTVKLDWQKLWIDWQKKLIKRLDREKLLGKNMRRLDKDLK